ncbi:hypothetical protein E0H75_12000 [Kribbella capetownensis]|uniref:Uncharacterized protein n=1 Tax=Kribbella capetownensis TaxID=1572659 RepID=A0A4R0JW70_9ACTN|nr:hypothetical protein [Kribbella capetownensis]TCC50877.1 hypothetical protein E0H75_12000 [Kribbella capetownensis]
MTDRNRELLELSWPMDGQLALSATVGAMTRTLGNWVVATIGVIGGLAYALAGGTFLLTDASDPFFPVSSGMALWAVIVGIAALRRRRGSSAEMAG